MTYKKLLINAGLAAFWSGVAYLLNDPRFIALAPVVRFLIGFFALKVPQVPAIPVDV